MNSDAHLCRNSSLKIRILISFNILASWSYVQYQTSSRIFVFLKTHHELTTAYFLKLNLIVITSSPNIIFVAHKMKNPNNHIPQHTWRLPWSDLYYQMLYILTFYYYFFFSWSSKKSLWKYHFNIFTYSSHITTLWPHCSLTNWTYSRTFSE